MKLFLDTEFNGFNGKLISMALVDEAGNEFYEVLSCRRPVPWVAENVIPKLNKEKISYKKFQKKLQDFFLTYEEPLEIIADWPEDIKHISHVLLTGPGQRMSYPYGKISFRVDSSLSSSNSAIPHNALEDAKALKKRFSHV